MTDNTPAQPETPTDPLAAAAAGTEPQGVPEGHAKTADDKHDGHGEHSGGGKAAALKAINAIKAKLIGALSGAKGGLSSLRGMFAGGLKNGVKRIVQSVISVPVLLIRGDLSTKLLIVGLVASVALVARTSSQLLTRFVPAKWLVPKTSPGQALSKFLEDEKKVHDTKASLLFLERFNATLDKAGGHPGAFEFELYVESDEARTAGVLRAHLAAAREAVSAAIQGHSYEELVTEAGKNGLKQDILEAVNRTLAKFGEKGQVRRVYFTRFVME